MLGDLVRRLLGRGEPAAPPAPIVPVPLAPVARLPVFYDARMNAPRLHSPSHGAEKPGLVLASWLALPVPLAIHPIAPVGVAALEALHEPGHVRGLLAGERMNGYNNTDLRVTRSELWKCGAVIAAAEHAARGRTVAIAPSCGFHHAHWRISCDHCTFNGHLLAAKRLLDAGLARRIALIDLDRHFGDGTQDILARLPLAVEHYSFSAVALDEMGVDGPRGAERWLRRLPDDLEQLAAGCDFAIVNPGADPHVDDPLGGFMTDEQMRRRDAIVFEALRDLGLPTVWTLGGGYRRPYRLVLDAHDATLLECWAALGQSDAAAG